MINNETNITKILAETMTNLFILVENCHSRETALELKRELNRPIGVLCARFGLDFISKRTKLTNARKRKGLASASKSNAYD